MHELSIAMSIIDVAGEEAERLRARVVAVHLKLGPLSGVVPEALLSAYERAREGSRLSDARLVIEEAALVVFCPACGENQPAAALQQICCSVCGSAGEVVGGREMEVTALEVIDDPPPPGPA